jgi:hypothetical protein
MMNEKQKSAKSKVFQDLITEMEDREAGRHFKTKPVLSLAIGVPEEGAEAHLDKEGELPEGGMSGEEMMDGGQPEDVNTDGMDPRLAEIIRRKKQK